MYCKRRFRSFGKGRGDLLITGKAEFGGADFPIKELVAELAFGLDAAQFGGGAVEESMGLGTGAVDGLLLRVIEHGIGFKYVVDLMLERSIGFIEHLNRQI